MRDKRLLIYAVFGLLALLVVCSALSAAYYEFNWTFGYEYNDQVNAGDVDSVLFKWWPDGQPSDSSVTHVITTPDMDSLFHFDSTISEGGLYWCEGIIIDNTHGKRGRTLFWQLIQDTLAGGSGSGEYEVIIYAYDTAASTVLADAEITIFNQAQTSQRWGVGTDENGYATYALDAGTYTVLGSGTREMAEVDTITVSDDMTDTLLFWSTLVSAASSPNLCTVYGILYKPDGTRLSNAQVSFALSSGVTDTSSGVTVSNYVIYATSNDTGYVETELIKNGNCIPEKSHYNVGIERSDIKPITYRIFIHADSTEFNFVTGGKIQ